jgi:hypothetical protein
LQTIQRNRLALTDEDALEYRTFESITSKEYDYKNSSHAVHLPYNLEALQGTHESDIAKKWYDAVRKGA